MHSTSFTLRNENDTVLTLLRSLHSPLEADGLDLFFQFDGEFIGVGLGNQLFLVHVAVECGVGLGAEFILHKMYVMTGCRCFAIKQLLIDHLVVFVHSGNGGVQGVGGNFAEG